MRISGQCSTLSTTGVITGKIRSQKDVIRRTSGCIFNKQVATVQ